MENSNWRPPAPGVGGGGGEAPPETDDWRSNFSSESRQRIINKIMDTLKKHLPVSGPDGFPELKKIAIRFEQKIFQAAANQQDYLRKITLKMLTMESKSQNPGVNTAANSSKPPDPGMQPQLQNQGTSIPNTVVGNQSQMRQQLQNNMAPSGVQGSATLNSTMPSISGINQTSLPNVLNQNSSMQNLANVTQNSPGNPMGQGLAPNVFVNQRQMQGRQQLVSQQQQSQNQQQYLYQQKLHNMMKQNLQQGNMSQSMMPSHMQQPQQQQQQQPRQQSIVPSNHIQSQQSTGMQPTGMQATGLANLQQNLQPMQQTTQPMLQQHQQSVMRHQIQPQQSVQQQSSLPQQQMMASQQQQTNMQQNQMMNQQNIGDMQQQHRMLNQQNSVPNIQLQQQQLLSQQNSLSNLHQQQLASQNNVSTMHQPQSVMSTQSGNSIQVGQSSAHMLQQPKLSVPRQLQSGSSNMLPGQQSQLLPVQQKMSQMQPQSGQLSQQMGLQQQQASLQRDMQQRLQASGSLPQSAQNMMDQQRQLYQSQRGLVEASSMPLDSTVQAGQAKSDDELEEIFMKLKSMKEKYLLDVNEVYQRVIIKLQQPKTEQVESLKMFKSSLERTITVLQLPKSEVHIGLKDMLPMYERQILRFVGTRPRRQLPQQHMPSVQPQQSQSPQQNHVQVQSNENQMNPQLQSMNLQGSVAPMQQNNLTSMQHASMSSFPGVATGQQHIMNALQSNSSTESAQSTMNSLQQVAVGSMQQNPASVHQQINIGAMSSQSGLNMLQPNVNKNLHASSDLLPQNLKQHQEQMQQQFKQQYQQHQMQLMQKQHILQQQQPQLNQQAKQQLQQFQGQMQPHQISQLHQMNEVKIRPGMGLKPGVFQQQRSAAGQRLAYSNQQLKTGSSFPISSPQILQALSPQISQHSSPQIDQQSLLTTLTNTGTPLQSTSSPFVVPSPSTPLAPSPMPVDSENQKPVSGMPSLSNAGNLNHQHTTAGPAGVQCLSIGTAGISTSPLLAEFSGADGSHGVAPTAVSDKSTMTEQPIERLIRAVKAASPQSLSDAVNDINSVVHMVDKIAGSAPGNGSRSAIGEDFVDMTRRKQHPRNYSIQDVLSGSRKIKRSTVAIPLNGASSAGSLNERVRRYLDAESSDLESTATSSIKRLKSSVNHTLIEEIVDTNNQLIDTVVDISDEDTVLSIAAEGNEEVIIKCSFTAVSLSPSLKLQYGSEQLPRIEPLRMRVPSTYPSCSPVLPDKFRAEVSEQLEDVNSKVKSRFVMALRSVSQPLTIRDIAKTWDTCSRSVILDYAEQNGGGSFISKYGAWESC
ncbi:hypothetical protein SAY86_010124 [Trapa natans]|uniref:Mediator complex subunit 15 KIX domain-containing protein n=1 Tax=Trapa natans TaxID=22666 RepID=A0AAN7QQ66_TRANT|nr:hypothetical protein SAY86_010124 [Trapa natans]